MRSPPKTTGRIRGTRGLHRRTKSLRQLTTEFKFTGKMPGNLPTRKQHLSLLPTLVNSLQKYPQIKFDGEELQREDHAEQGIGPKLFRNVEAEVPPIMPRQIEKYRHDREFYPCLLRSAQYCVR